MAISFPYLFETINQPSCVYIVIPRHTLENRPYILIKICAKHNINIKLDFWNTVLIYSKIYFFE